MPGQHVRSACQISMPDQRARSTHPDQSAIVGALLCATCSITALCCCPCSRHAVQPVMLLLQVNTKTRNAAYELLVQLARELDEARPAALLPLGSGGGGGASDSDDMEYGATTRHAAATASAAASGGLMDFVTSVMAGLVGATPHMQSASVLALARLVFEFGGALGGTAVRLLPAVLLLLRSSSREVVKSVLGFIKVWRGSDAVQQLYVVQ